MAKHWIGYEQQHYRLPSKEHGTAAVSSNIDDRTMHELYMWPFQDCIRAGAASIMCSYNMLNGSSTCQNSKALNGLLKTELGFQGYVISDWGAQRGGIASADAGLDVAMPTSPLWGASGGNLSEAVRNGSLSDSRLRDMATRIIGAWYQLGQDEGYPETGIGMPLDFTNHKPVRVDDHGSRDVVLQAAIEGHVLVKNVNKTLPLQKPGMLSIFGYDAPAPRTMNTPANNTNDTQNNGWIFGTASNPGLGPYGQILQGGLMSLPAISPDGTLITGAGSGATAPKYISATFDAITQRAYEDGTAIFYDFESSNPAINDASDACLVFINAFAGEGADRPALHDNYSDSIVLNVASQCSNTIVVIHNAGIRLVDQWIDHDNVTAVIFGHLPGQDSGRAVAQILYGHVSPSGKMPYTVAKNESDYEAYGPDAPEEKYTHYPQSDFAEGVFLDYKHADKNGLQPRFEFGFGLSYSTFECSDLSIEFDSTKTLAGPPHQEPVIPGGNPALWEETVTAKVTVTNTGDVHAAEAAQLYLGLPGEGNPIRQLRGFEKALIPAGQSVQYSFSLNRRDISMWDVVSQDWAVQGGVYKIYVGRSSRDLPLEGSFEVTS